MDDRWAKLEEIVRRVVREELSTLNPQKKKIGFKNGRFTGIGEQELTAMREAYPAVEIEKELKEMQAWIVMNPEDAPVSNYSAFINRWLKQHQNQHSLKVIPTQRQEIKRRACAYCSADSVGNWGGYEHCTDPQHKQWAKDGMPRRMLGVVPKPVSGND